MAFTIVSDVCEACLECLSICPVECIHFRGGPGQVNVHGAPYSVIDGPACIDCGSCQHVCPIEGAILDEWKPELQKV